MTIAESVKEVMHERGETFIWIGTVELLDHCAERIGKASLHPIVRNRQILNALEHSRCFKKEYIIVEISLRKRKVRCFRLIE